MQDAFKFCPSCATPLQNLGQMEDGGEKYRLRCPACGWTHWNNPTPVLAAVIEYEGKVLLARNAAWPGRMFALITGFMEAGESPQAGIAREVKEETNLDIEDPQLLGVWDFQRMNQIIIAYHAVAHGRSACHPSWPNTSCTSRKTWCAGQRAPDSRWRSGCAAVATSPLSSSFPSDKISPLRKPPWTSPKNSTPAD